MEEKIIDRVLHWRYSPEAAWNPYTAEGLTAAFMAERARADNFESKAKELSTKLENVRIAIGDLR